MATKYTLTLHSTVADAWKFAVWKQFPDLPGAIPVAWKCVGLAPGSLSNPTTMKITWYIKYGVFLQDPVSQVSPNTIWESTQAVDTQLGAGWQIKDVPVGDETVQSIAPLSTNPSGGTVSVRNNSASLASIGLGMDGNVMCVVPDVQGGLSVNGTFKPTYYIGVFKNIKTSQVLDVSVSTSPLEVVFGEGVTDLHYTLKLVGNSLVIVQGKPASPAAFMAGGAINKPTAYQLTAGAVNSSVVLSKLASADLQERLADAGCSIHQLLLPASPDQKSVEVHALSHNPAAFEKAVRSYLADQLPSISAEQFAVKSLGQVAQ